MPLPFSRNTTYAIKQQVKSVDLNAIQDAIVAQHNRAIHFAAGPSFLSGDVGFDQNGSFTANPASGGQFGQIDLTPWLIPGDTIASFVARWKNGVTPSATGEITFLLTRCPIATPFAAAINVLTGVALEEGDGVQDVDTGGAGVTRSVTVDLDHVVLENNLYLLGVTLDSDAGNDQVGFGGFTVNLGA